MSDGVILVEDWRENARALHASGHTWFGGLTAIDNLALGRLEVVLVVAPPGQIPTTQWRTSIDRIAPSIDSLSDIWAGALFAERETAEMFGVDFIGHPDLRPLLLPAAVASPPLRADVGLVRRSEADWPGEVEPGDDKPKRRRNRAMGSDDSEWVTSV